MSLAGDFSALSALIRSFEQAADPDKIAKLSHALAAEALQLMQSEFVAQKDPYGAAWAPLKVRAGMILSDTGRLRGSVTANSDGGEVRLRVPTSYAVFHQHGTKRMPKRQILPNDGDLPGEWRAAFTDVTTELIQHLLSG